MNMAHCHGDLFDKVDGDIDRKYVHAQHIFDQLQHVAVKILTLHNRGYLHHEDETTCILIEIEHFEDGSDARKLLEGCMLLTEELEEYLIIELVLADDLGL
jgi:hypothetical protein